MKHFSFIRVASVAAILCATSLSAQQVNTIYFLENSPYRSVINPAFQPVSSFYLELPILGYTSAWTGNNTLNIQDLIFKYNDKTVTAFYNEETQQQLWNKLPQTILADVDLSTNLLSFGFRVKDFGYVHLNVTERFEIGTQIPRQMFSPLLGQSITSMDLTALGNKTNIWTDIALGYSHRINEHWTVGGKIKLVLGNAYAGFTFDKFKLNLNPEQIDVRAQGQIQVAGPLNWSMVPPTVSMGNMEWASNLMQDFMNNWKQYLKPNGYGGAIDLGFTYKPIDMVQISASVTDLGAIYWNNAYRGTMDLGASFNGVGEIQYSDLFSGGQFHLDTLISRAGQKLSTFGDSITFNRIENAPFSTFMTPKLNVGVDVNFWNNRVGVGIYNRTRFYLDYVYNEVTLGAALRPCNWFNLAASYSFINSRGGAIGAAISLAPYDGLMFTVAADYIPLSIVKDANNRSLAYKTNGLNIAFGVCIVAGTNHRSRNKDTDHDGVPDLIDACPLTPTAVRVDALGCPIDSDGDGVPDYLDKCSGTPSAAYGLIDSVGCPLDRDSDGVPDYRDQCPNTPVAARHSVNENGCFIDTDGDGVPDYLDQCPNTPAAAYGKVDSVGCPLDTDSDGVADYLDQCPNTPVAARASVDQFGCPLDTDKDGVPDYMDQCPNTPVAARNMVDSVGCELDTDGDGVPDYEDLCPTIPGSANNHGCPEVKREVRNLLQKAMQGIQFENGKSTIKPTSFPLLDQIAQIFIENKSYHIEVQGHTDNVGKPEFNQDLSDKRAQAVRDYLVKKGVQPTRIEAHGYGDTKPVADNTTKAGRAQNRRVEFVITFEEVTYETINDRVTPQDSIHANQ